MAQQSYTIFIIIAVILFSIYRRVRKSIGWQPLKRGGLQFKMGLFLIVGLLFLVNGLSHPISLLSDVIGIVLGIILAYYGAALTTFEERKGQLFYRTNMWIGSIVIVLFLFRFIYRFYMMFFTAGTFTGLQQGQTNDFQTISSSVGNSWTAGLMLIMFAYYIFYYMILLRKHKQFAVNNETSL